MGLIFFFAFSYHLISLIIHLTLTGITIKIKHRTKVKRSKEKRIFTEDGKSCSGGQTIVPEEEDV